MSGTRRTVGVVVAVLLAALIVPAGAYSAVSDSDSASGFAVVKEGKRCKKVDAGLDVTGATKVTASVVSNVNGVAVQRVVRLKGDDELKFCLDSPAPTRTKIAWIAHNGAGVADSAHLHDGRYYTKAQINALHAKETRFLSIAPAEFQPRWPDKTVYNTDANGGLVVTGGTEDQFYAGVHLPGGATIKAMHAWVTDEILFADPAPNLDVKLYALRFDSGYISMASVNSVYQPTATMLTDDTILGPAQVDNQGYMYVVRVHVPSTDWSTWGSDLRLEGVIIEYTVEG